MRVVAADLGPQLAPLRHQVIPDAIAQLTADRRHELEAEPLPILAPDTIGAHRPAVAVQHPGGLIEVVVECEIRIVESGQGTRDR